MDKTNADDLVQRIKNKINELKQENENQRYKLEIQEKKIKELIELSDLQNVKNEIKSLMRPENNISQPTPFIRSKPEKERYPSYFPMF